MSRTPYRIWHNAAACPKARGRDLAPAHECMAPRNLTRFELGHGRSAVVRILTWTGWSAMFSLALPAYEC
jgi:hypothetical protein